MGFDENGYLYVVVNRLHNFVAGRLEPNEVNFRILRSKTGTLSYVHTGRASIVEENLLNIGGGAGPIYEIQNNNLGNGISSTTPIYLGSVGTRFGGVGVNSGLTLQISAKTLLLTGLLAVLLKKFV